MSSNNASDALTGAGGLFGSIGAIKQGQMSQAAGYYNAEVADYNAQEILKAGDIAVQHQKREAAQAIGQARVQYSANGIDANEGSALDVLQNSAANAALESINLKHQYQAKSYGYTATANLSRYQGDQALNSSYYSAAGQLLSSAGAIIGAG